MTLDLLECEQNTSRVNDFGFVRIENKTLQELMTLDLLECEQNTSRVNDFGFVRMRTHYC